MKRTTFLWSSLAAISTLFIPWRKLNAEEKNQEGKQVGFNHLPKNKNNHTMKTVYHAADTRGNANHGWLNANHTFSFANYYDPSRMNFGVLRVLNDDIVQGGKGFGTHPHNNMEIITIPLNGSLAHKDDMGNSSTISNTEIQVMSAGSGITHSEFNAHPTEEVNLLQIWVFPNKRNVTPRYDQYRIPAEKITNRFHQILSPNAQDEGVWIHQDAWFHLGEFTQNQTTTYTMKKSGNGIYVFLLSGAAQIDDQQLNTRDGLGVWDTTKITLTISQNSKLLLMEIPMA